MGVVGRQMSRSCPFRRALRHPGVMDDEPLAEWARRRDERRAQTRGRLRAVPLTEGPHRAAHISPATPRAIQRWDGTEWVTESIAANLASAQALLYPPQPVEERPAEWDRPLSVRAVAGTASPPRPASPGADPPQSGAYGRNRERESRA
ncbi:DUF6087 family protein [Streptomyces sp. NPDC019396]|uniref:DUF6087 family protein n=1 Tax=Streptomyces sp. NPDC019396 TaxID=3154687 RepID=UPI0033ED7804